MTLNKLMGIVAAVVAVLTFVVTAFSMEMPVLYVISLMVAAVGIALDLTVIIYKSVKKEMTAGLWQLVIYAALGIVGWIIATVSSTWLVCSIGLAAMVCGLAMLIGTFILKRIKESEAVAEEVEANSEQVQTAIEEESEDVKKLMSSLRYEYIDDDITKSSNLDKPLCLVNGNALTVIEADAAGYTEIANAGLAYIKKLYS